MSDAPKPGASPRLGPDFRRLWLGEFASVFGSQLSFVATPLLALHLTGSPALAGVVGLVNTAVRVAAGLPAGVLVDQHNRRLVLLVCDGARAGVVALFVIALVVLPAPLAFGALLLCIGVEGAFSVAFPPAEQALLHRLLPAETLTVGLARNESREWSASVIGPVAGGALYGFSPVLPFLGNALSYVVSLLCVWRVPSALGAIDRATVPPTSVGCCWRGRSGGECCRSFACTTWCSAGCSSTSCWAHSAPVSLRC